MTLVIENTQTGHTVVITKMLPADALEKIATLESYIAEFRDGAAPAFRYFIKPDKGV